MALLYCLAKLGVVGQSDAQALVTRVFHRYLQLMRKIQVGSWDLFGFRCMPVFAAMFMQPGQPTPFPFSS